MMRKMVAPVAVKRLVHQFALQSKKHHIVGDREIERVRSERKMLNSAKAEEYNDPDQQNYYEEAILNKKTFDGLFMISHR
jgi:hypothetical protein